jgi:hypothetical protein
MGMRHAVVPAASTALTRANAVVAQTLDAVESPVGDRVADLASESLEPSEPRSCESPSIDVRGGASAAVVAALIPALALTLMTAARQALDRDRPDFDSQVGRCVGTTPISLCHHWMRRFRADHHSEPSIEPIRTRVALSGERLPVYGSRSASGRAVRECRLSVSGSGVAGRWCPTRPVGPRAGGGLTRVSLVVRCGLTGMGCVAHRRPWIAGVT